MEKRLIRKMPGKMIGGVAAGLADYLDIDATIVRLLFVLATFFHGSGLLIYIVLWIAMPAGPQENVYSGQTGGSGPGASPGTGTSPGADAFSGASSSPGGAHPAGSPFQNTGQQPAGSASSGNRSAAVIGWILVGLGIFFLMDEFLEPWFRDFFYWFNFRRIWPVVFIIVGVLIISSATKKEAARHADNPDVPGGSGASAGSAASGPPAEGEGYSATGENPSAPERKPRVPGEGPLNDPDSNDKV